MVPPDTQDCRPHQARPEQDPEEATHARVTPGRTHEAGCRLVAGSGLPARSHDALVKHRLASPRSEAIPSLAADTTRVSLAGGF